MPIETRREQVLDAALELIGEQGYSAVTMEGVARRAALSKPVVYNAYNGLGPLLKALLKREQARAFQTLFDALPPHPAADDPTETAVFWLRQIADAIVANPTSWRLMVIPPEQTPELVREKVHRGRALAIAQARTLTQELLRRNPRLGGLDPELSAQALFAVAESGAKALVHDPTEQNADRLMHFAEQLLLRSEGAHDDPLDGTPARDGHGAAAGA